MPQRFLPVFAIGLGLLATACAQGPAPVDMKGQNSYTHNTANAEGAYRTTGSASGYGHDTYIPPDNAAPPTTQQNAAVSSIGVSDLSAPPVAAQPTPPPPSQPASGAPVNPWTNKPHFNDAGAPAPQTLAAPPAQQPVADLSAKPSQPVAQLDSIISKDSAAPPAAAPVAAAAPAPVEIAAAQPAAKPAASAKFIWPVADHKLLSAFGPKGGGKSNDGINIASGEGEPVWAAADGEVVYVGNELKGYGTMVLIKHAGNKSTSYAHLSRASVEKYDRVKQGQIIGYVGATGDVKEPQLHFAVREGKEPVNPEKYLN